MERVSATLCTRTCAWARVRSSSPVLQAEGAFAAAAGERQKVKLRAAAHLAVFPNVHHVTLSSLAGRHGTRRDTEKAEERASLITRTSRSFEDNARCTLARDVFVLDFVPPPLLLSAGLTITALQRVVARGSA